MFKGILVGLGIILGSILPPAAHFILFPPSPFFAGYFGINYARPEEGSYAVKGLVFGSILAIAFPLMLFIGVLPALFAAAIFFDADLGALYERNQKLIWILVVVLTMYTGSMSTLGAMFSALQAQNAQRKAEAESEPSPEAS